MIVTTHDLSGSLYTITEEKILAVQVKMQYTRNNDERKGMAADGFTHYYA